MHGGLGLETWILKIFFISFEFVKDNFNRFFAPLKNAFDHHMLKSTIVPRAGFN